MAYYCHQCNRRVNVNSSLQCEDCCGEFIEEVDNDDFLSDTNTGSEAPNANTANPQDSGAEFYFSNDGEGRRIVYNSYNSLFNRIFEQVINNSQGAPSTSNNQTSGGRIRFINTNNDGNIANISGSGGIFQRNVTPGTSRPITGGDPIMSFFNQLMSNLSEGGEGGSPSTRLTFHIDGTTGTSGFQQIYGNFNDYVWGQGGIDHIVTQLLNQFESGNSDNISPEDISRLPMTEVNLKQVENGTQCATCMETFVLNEPVAKLDCQHIFHRPCIEPWLKKHNTCPICRKVVDPKSWGPKITDIDELD